MIPLYEIQKCCKKVDLNLCFNCTIKFSDDFGKDPDHIVFVGACSESSLEKIITAVLKQNADPNRTVLIDFGK
jgi:hypothetical protein